MTMATSFLYALNYPIVGDTNKNMTTWETRSKPSGVVKLSSFILIRIGKNENFPEVKNIPSLRTSSSLLRQRKTVGIIGGVHVSSTLIFLEKLIWLSSRNGEEESLPFIVCSDPALNKDNTYHNSADSFQVTANFNPIVDNLRSKRAFLESSGAKCIVMPCHFAHAWHDQVSDGSSVPFLHIGESVCVEIKEAMLKPLEAGSRVRIGVLATSAILNYGFYQKILKDQGFEVVLPDKQTMEHILNPAIEALNRKDMEGARNLVRIAIQILLMRAVNKVILASDEIQDILPQDDPLLKKCIDPVDALVRSTLKWARSQLRWVRTSHCLHSLAWNKIMNKAEKNN